MKPLSLATPRPLPAFPRPQAAHPGVPGRSLAVRAAGTPGESPSDRLLAELADIARTINRLSCAAAQAPAAPKVPDIPPTYIFGHGAYFAAMSTR